MASAAAMAQETRELEFGMIGLDTSHVISVADAAQRPRRQRSTFRAAGIVCAYKAGSPNVELEPDPR